MDIAGKKVTVLGGKRSGLAAARLARRLKAAVKVSERDDEAGFDGPLTGWAAEEGVAVEFNGHTRAFVEDSDLIVLSPGVPFNAPPVEWARAKGIPVLGEIEFAAQFCPCPIIAVTGSNGKTTVSTLISKTIEQSGAKACLCGNVGHPFSGFVLDLKGTDYAVLEVSSFQLESVLEPVAGVKTRWGLKGFKPRVAVILNFSQNHLDRHKDMDDYFFAKQRIFINQDEQDVLLLNHHDAPLTLKPRSRVVYFNGPDRPDDVTNPNHLAVLAAARALGIDERFGREVFRGFTGVEHRMERVRSLDGVDYINDSKATTAQAALWALENLGRPVVMICGGRDKNIDFTVMKESVQEKVKRMFVIGEARDKIREAFGDVIDLEECEGLNEAVAKARALAARGDCVLLSPMCASFDMFRDFEDRGRKFKEIVNGLK